MIRPLLFALMSAALSLPAQAGNLAIPMALVMGKTPAASVSLFAASDAEIDTWLKSETQAGLPFDERLHHAVDAALGTPYQDGPLGEGPDGKYDKDPLIDLKHVDCVTFIEQSIALAASPDLKGATDLLQRIRYRSGVIDFGTRNHFFEADWLRNNNFCKELTPTLGLPTEKVTRTIDRAAFFRKVNAPDLLQNVKPEPVTVTYIPTSAAEKAEAVIPDGCIIAFIGKVDWLFSLHTGIFLKDANGPRLCHASSKAGKAASMDFSDYVASQKDRYIGFIVYKINKP